jgi:small-conductance mechanosensitive channel
VRGRWPPGGVPLGTLAAVIEDLADALNITRVQAQLVITGAVIFLLAVIRIMVLAVVRRRIEDTAVWYRTRKLLSYTITLVGFVVLATIWLEGSGIATYIGFLTAGLAIALSDVLKNLAGWLYIVTRRPFRLGDRVEIHGHRGDVIDIRAFRFTMLEVENRVSAEQSTGRLLHMPNGLIFTEALANYTEGFRFIWHELPVLITFESNWEQAEEIVLDAVKEVSPDASAAAAMREVREAAAEYRIEFTHLTPTAYLTVRESGVLITGRFLVDPRRTRVVEEEAWKIILRAIAQRDDIELAYPTMRTYFGGPIQLEGSGPDGRPSLGGE